MCQLCAPEGRRTSARSDGCVGECAVVNDADADFGHVVTPAHVVVSDLHSAHIEEADLERLVELRSRELLQLVDGVADRISDEAGLCDAAVHRVQATSNFVRRQLLPCRKPDMQVQAGSRLTEYQTATEERRRPFMRAERTYLQPIHNYLLCDLVVVSIALLIYP